MSGLFHVLCNVCVGVHSIFGQNFQIQVIGNMENLVGKKDIIFIWIDWQERYYI